MYVQRFAQKSAFLISVGSHALNDCQISSCTRVARVVPDNFLLTERAWAFGAAGAFRNPRWVRTAAISMQSPMFARLYSIPLPDPTVHDPAS